MLRAHESHPTASWRASQGVGALHEQAMAIGDISARLDFLNRGQACVVRKLEALLPTIRDDNIYAEFKAMLASHRQNIDLESAQLPQPISGCPARHPDE